MTTSELPSPSVRLATHIDERAPGSTRAATPEARQRRDVDARLLRVASQQRSVLYSLLACMLIGAVQGVALFAGGDDLVTALLLPGAAASVALYWFLLRLCLELYDTPVAVVTWVSSLIPLLGFVVIAIVSRKAAAELRTVGVRTGLMGANAEARARLRERANGGKRAALDGG